jgi:hypothetical protein
LQPAPGVVFVRRRRDRQRPAVRRRPDRHARHHQGDASPLWVLGVGGAERWVAYPVILWLMGFGGYLAGRAEERIDIAVG